MSRRRGLGFSGAVLGRRGEHWPGLVHRPVRRSRACRLRLARRALSICAALGARLTPWPVEGRLPACAASLGEVDEVKRAKDESFRGVLERAGEQARRRRVQATTELVPGHAAEVIAHHASAHGHDLIVIGHRGHFLGDYLPGSVCVSACLAGAERSDDEVQGGDGAGDDGESAAVGVDLMGHLADVERGEGEHREPDHREEPMPSAPAQHSARQGQGEGDREGDQRGALGVDAEEAALAAALSCRCGRRLAARARRLCRVLARRLLCIGQRSGCRRWVGPYDESVLRRMTVIDVAQRAGLSLDEIRELVDAGSEPVSDQLRELAERKLPEVDALIDRAQRVRAWLQTATGCGCQTIGECGLFDDRQLASAGEGRALVVLSRNGRGTA
jgi:nucleotide-binding universal stress UspA family protein